MDSKIDRDETRSGDDGAEKKPWETPVVNTEGVDEITEGGPFEGAGGDDALYKS